MSDMQNNEDAKRMYERNKNAKELGSAFEKINDALGTSSPGGEKIEYSGGAAKTVAEYMGPAGMYLKGLSEYTKESLASGLMNVPFDAVS